MKQVIVALFFCASTVAAQDVASLTAAVERAAAQDQFSGVVFLVKDGKPILSKAYGMADPSRDLPNRIDTRFNLGSINKIFTQVAIAQLAAAGKLSLDDTIRKHLPDYPSPVAEKITIRQLVEHRSGLGDIFGERFFAARSSLRKLSDYLPLFADKPLEFEPGTDQRYSNAGYIVLGLIIERISGQSYYDYVREHIFKPARMNDSDSFAVDEQVANRAVGQTKRGPEGPLRQRQSNKGTLPARGSSAGGGYSTAQDLVRFTEALVANKLTPQKWTDWLLHSGRSLAIAGGAPGINAVLEMEPPYTLVVLSNYDPPSAETVARSFRVAQTGRRMVRPEPPGEVLIHGPVQLSWTMPGHLPVIEAKINDKGPYRFAIDTGFGGNMQVSSALAEQLRLPIVDDEIIGGDPSGKNTRTMKLAEVESVDVGSAHFGQVNVAIGEGAQRAGADGIIGLNLFNSLLATFDYPNQKLEIRGGTLPAGDGVLSYTVEHGVPAIEIDVAGQKFKADIDSGSPAEVTLPLSAAKTLALSEEPRVVGHGRTVGNTFDVYGAALKGDVRIADIVLTNPRLDFVEIFPIGNVGSRFLRNLVVTFDPKNHRVRFVKP
jgi:CubicO group peptidase (beta-lactamase class C family)/predicted aspartyl protease